MSYTREQEEEAIRLAPAVIEVLSKRTHPQNWYTLEPLYTKLRRTLRANTAWRHGYRRVAIVGRQALEGLAKYTSIEGKHFLDLGCGFYNPIGVSFYFYINGASECTAFDIQDCDRERAAEAVAELILDAIGERSELVTSSSRTEVLDKISKFNASALNNGNLADGLACAPINYIIVNAHDMSQIRDESIDLVNSQAVFEHIQDIPATFDTLYKKMKPGGVARIVIDLVDHRAYDMPDKYNYFSFLSALDTEPDNGVCNRLRASQYIDILANTNFEVLDTETDKQDVPSEILSNLSPEFQKLTEDDLRATGLTVVIKKPATRNYCADLLA